MFVCEFVGVYYLRFVFGFYFVNEMCGVFGYNDFGFVNVRDIL